MKKYLVSIIFLILGTGCAIAYKLIGSEVAPDGTLTEPFALIPLSWLFIIIGISKLTIAYIKK